MKPRLSRPLTALGVTGLCTAALCAAAPPTGPRRYGGLATPRSIQVLRTLEAHHAPR